MLQPTRAQRMRTRVLYKTRTFLLDLGMRMKARLSLAMKLDVRSSDVDFCGDMPMKRKNDARPITSAWFRSDSSWMSLPHHTNNQVKVKHAAAKVIDIRLYNAHIHVCKRK